MRTKTYDILKYVAQVALPAFIVLYSALAGFWGWPYTEAIVGTLAAVDAFIGKLLMVKSDEYFDDHVIVEKDGDIDG